MRLSFPNENRYYNQRTKKVQFWGHDSALEITFFVDVNALQKLEPLTEDTEVARLTTFDAAVKQIHEAACRKYSRNSKNVYNLVAEDF